MKLHTEGFKQAIKTHGKEIDSIITYRRNGNVVELGANELNSVTPSFQGSILKSVMKQLDIDSNVEIPEKTVLRYQFGVKVNGSFEYLDFGEYIVYKVEKQEDTYSYKITCYDKLLYSMVEYNSVEMTYPTTVRSYLTALCNKLGLTFKNSSGQFANYDKPIPSDLYQGLGYTFRDVLDELAQVTASTICLDNNGQVEIRYINQTSDEIDEYYLKDVNVNFGQKYGPVNTIVLSRSAGADKISQSIPSDLPDNEKVAIEISDNQIMNFNNRDIFIPDILAQLNGLEYYINDFSSPGICYYDLCDRYSVRIGENVYSCVMFNDEINVTQGLEENVFTEMPEEGEQEYTKMDKTDRKINQTYLIVDKQNQRIESVVSQTEEQNEKISRITQTVDELNSKISDIADITTSNESNAGYVDLEGINESEPIRIVVRPVVENISYLYPSAFLYPNDDLFMKSRILRFTNKTTGVSKDYELPNDLWYLDSEHYDEFVLDYDAGTCQVIKRLEYRLNDIATGVDLSGMELRMNFPEILGTYANVFLFYSENYRVREIFEGDTDKIVLEDLRTFETIETFYEQHGSDDAIINLKSYKLPDDFGEVIFVASKIEALQTQAQALNYINYFDNQLYVKPIEQTIDYKPYPKINLEDGDYRISLPGYTYGYIFARLMAKNIYTTQFATYAYVNSEIKQTATEITSTVEEGYATKDTTNSLSSRISQTAKSIELTTKDNNTSAGITIRLKNENGTEIDSKSANITMSGLVKFTDLSGSGSTTINGSNITTGTIDASKVTVKNLNASNITSGTISGSKISGGTINGNNVTISNLNASNITSGTLSADKISGGTINASNIAVTNITASNINRGSLTGANIDINNGTGFLRMLSGSAYNPYVSALNVSNKSNGISFRNSNTSGNAGSQIGTLHTEGNNLVMDATGNILIGGSSMSSGAIGIWSGYIHAGNLNMGENYINNSNGGQIAINQSISLNTSGGGYAYVDGLYANNRILTVGGSPSTLSVKENVEKKDISNIPEILREIDLYDYKYKKEIEDGKEDYGYIIDYLEKIPNIEKYFEFYEAEKSGIKYKQISHEQLEKFLLGSVIELQRQLDEMKDMIYNMKERIDK